MFFAGAALHGFVWVPTDKAGGLMNTLVAKAHSSDRRCCVVATASTGEYVTAECEIEFPLLLGFNVEYMLWQTHNAAQRSVTSNRR